MHTRLANPRSLGILAGLLLLGSAPSALAQIAVDQAMGVRGVPCGQIGLGQDPVSC